MGSFIYLFVSFTKLEDKLKYIILGIINIFISFVVSELIILRFCGLDYNTKREIEIRAIEIEYNYRKRKNIPNNKFRYYSY